MLFDLIKNIFTKNLLDVEVTIGDSISLSKWISLDIGSIKYVRKVSKYIFITPVHFYYLLYFIIPKGRTPFLKKIEKVSIKNNDLFEKTKYLFDWSSKELSYNKFVLNTLDKSYWNKELGIK
jgi:hypothetical protein